MEVRIARHCHALFVSAARGSYLAIVVDTETIETIASSYGVADPTVIRALFVIVDGTDLCDMGPNRHILRHLCLNEEGVKKNTTHMEIDPFTILGVVAGLIWSLIAPC